MSKRGASPIDRLRRTLGARLQRRLFVWFALTMLATAVFAVSMTWLVGRLLRPEFSGGMERPRRFFAHQLARVWDTPAERDALVHALATELDTGVSIRDTQGRLLRHVGKECSNPKGMVDAVRRGDQVLGQLEMCPHHGPPRPLLLTGALALVALWAAAGLLARRLSRPLEDVARIAEQIAEGNLQIAAQPLVGGRHSQDEVAVVGDVLRQMAARVDKQLRDQRELLAAVSHELRTPLGHLRLVVDSWRQNPHPEPKLLDQAERELQDLDSLVGQLLANARLEFRELRLQRLAAVDLAIEALERASLDPTLLEVQGENLWVQADPALLQRAIANLIDNARKHGGGAVALRLYRLGERLHLEVQDDGPGFANGEELNAFAPFTGAGHRAESLGLGLHLVERIAQAHGGSAYARNAEERGAVVGFELGLAPELPGRSAV